MPYNYVTAITNFQAGQVGGVSDSKLLLIGKADSAASGYNVLKEIKSLAEAQAEYGTSDANAADLINMVEVAFNQTVPPSRLFCIAVGKWTDSATTAVPAAVISKGDSSLVIATDVTATWTVGKIVKISNTGEVEEFVRIKTSVYGAPNTTITFEDYEKAADDHAVTATLTLIDDGDADHADNAAYEAAYATMLSAPLTDGGEIDFVTIDSWFQDDILDLETNVDTAAANDRERLAIVGVGAGENTAAGHTGQASAIDNWRFAVVGSNFLDASGEPVRAGITCTAVIVAIMSENDPAMPVHEIPILGFTGFQKEWLSTEIDTLRAGGVMPLWTSVTGIRTIEYGLVTNTDATVAPVDIEIARIADYVEKYLRSGIKKTFPREKGTATTLNNINAWLKNHLDTFVAKEIIDGSPGKEPTFSVEFEYNDVTQVYNKKKAEIIVNFYPMYAIKQITITNSINLG